MPAPKLRQALGEIAAERELGLGAAPWGIRPTLRATKCPREHQIAAMAMPTRVRVARLKATEEKSRAAQQALAHARGRDHHDPDPAGLPEVAPLAQEPRDDHVRDAADRHDQSQDPVVGTEEQTQRDIEAAGATAVPAVGPDHRSGAETSLRELVASSQLEPLGAAPDVAERWPL